MRGYTSLKCTEDTEQHHRWVPRTFKVRRDTRPISPSASEAVAVSRLAFHFPHELTSMKDIGNRLEYEVC